MWQRFSERARRGIFYAQEEAHKFGEGYVSTEHILLGLTRDKDSTAAQVLEKLDASLERIRKEVEKQLPRGDARPSQDMTLTPRAKRVIDLAYEEARNLGNNYIGTEHLLLGLVRESDGLAGKVLDKLGVKIDNARAVTMELQGAQPARKVEATQPPREQDPAAAVEHLETNLFRAFRSASMLLARSIPEQLVLAALDDDAVRAFLFEQSLPYLGLQADVMTFMRVPFVEVDNPQDDLRQVLDTYAAASSDIAPEKKLGRLMIAILQLRPDLLQMFEARGFSMDAAKEFFA